jgi:glycosyltransferase involved in cell wall biosynthesis
MISGAAIAVERLAQGMAERGHHVLVIAASEKIHPYHSVNGNMTVLRLKSIHNPLRVGQRFLLYPRTEVMNILQNFRPDIIHAHEPLLCWIGFEYAKRNNIPNTLTVHMLPWVAAALFPDFIGIRKMFENIGWMYLKALSRKTTSLITTTTVASNVVEKKLGLHTETIPGGIDTKVFRPLPALDRGTATRTRLNLSPDVPIILHVGRLDTEKNVNRIIQASVPVIQQTNAHLLIVGDGRERSALMKLGQTLGIADHIHFAGYISMEDGLPEIYRMATVFVMASEVESQGLVLLEAAASGLPLVALDTTTISEIVHDQVNGYLVKVGNIPALSMAISKIINDPEMAREMGSESRKLAQNYDSLHVQELHEQFYTRLIEPRKVRSHSRRLLWKRVKVWMGFNK